MKPLFTQERKKAIFLDMNRTLLDPERAFDQAFVTVLEEFTARSAADLDGAPERLLELYRKALRSVSAKAGKGGAARARVQALTVALKETPITLGQEQAKLLLRRIEEKKESSPKLHAGVRETLEKLARSYRLAVISNGSTKRQEHYIFQLGLADLLPPGRLFTFQKDGMRKPDPAIFHHALEAMGLHATQAVMIGDSWKNDVMGAAGVGMDAVWIHPGAGKKNVLRKVGSVRVVVIKTFDQLNELFSRTIHEH